MKKNLLIGVIILFTCISLAQAAMRVPFYSEIELSETPKLNEEFKLQIQFGSYRETDTRKVTLHFPEEGIEYIDGFLTWEGNLEEGENKSFETTLKVVEEGTWLVYIEGMGTDQRYVKVTNQGSHISKNPFPEMQRNESSEAEPAQANINPTTISQATTIQPSFEEEVSPIESVVLHPLPNRNKPLADERNDIASATAISAATTNTVFSEGFEGSFCDGCNGWSVGDRDSDEGNDYWNDIDYKDRSGSYSAWAAGIGSQSGTIQQVIVSEDFEGSFPGDEWSVGDSNGNSGEDYWDDVSCESNEGGWSLWVADIGNSDCTTYDNDMDAFAIRKFTVDASEWNSAVLSFDTKYDIEDDYDYFQVIVSGDSGSSWDALEQLDGSRGWHGKSYNIPSSYLTSQFAWGFLFHSDGSVVEEGVYIDDITLTATLDGTQSNTELRKHDNDMDAYMSRSVDLSGYESASLEFYHLMPSVEGGSFDYGRVRANGNEIARYDSAVTSWTKETLDLTPYAGGSVTLEWNFIADGSITNEGWYIDDITVTATTPGDITIKGYYYYTNRQGNSVPANGVTVIAYDQDALGIEHRLGSDITDTNGYYEIGPVSNDDGLLQGTLDVYVRFLASSNKREVQDASDAVYDGFSVTKDNVPDGDVWFPDTCGNGNGCIYTPPANEMLAWQVYFTLYDGLNFLFKSPISYDTSKIVAKWEDGHDADFDNHGLLGTHYHHGDEMHLDGRRGSGPGGGHANDEDVILHEYGHHVMWDAYNSFPNSNCPSPHNWFSDEHVNCAWTEGWANFFPLAVYNDENMEDTTQNFVINFEDQTDDVPNNPWDTGDDVEGRVAAALWDLIDTGNEDEYDGNFNDDVWETFERQDDDNFEEYWQAWQADHTDEEEEDALAALLGNTINYYTTENDCANGVDDDQDGFTDCNDGDCTQGSQSQNGFCCGTGCSVDGGSCSSASTSGFTCTDGTCNSLGEACQNGERESSLFCSGTSLSCDGGTCEANFGAPEWCDEISPSGTSCVNSPGTHDELACEATGNDCYYEAESSCGAPSGCDEEEIFGCSQNTGLQCEWQGGYGDNVVEECDSSCSAISACDESSPGDHISTCITGGESYFADECSSSCQGTDRDQVCRSSGFATGCTADPECNGIVAGTQQCSLQCQFTQGEPAFTIKDTEKNTVAMFSTNGNVILSGTLDQQSNYIATSTDLFKIRHNGNDVLIVDSQGNLHIDENVYENQEEIPDPQSLNTFRVHDASDKMTIHVTESGSLYISGQVVENS